MRHAWRRSGKTAEDDTCETCGLVRSRWFWTHLPNREPNCVQSREDTAEPECSEVLLLKVMES